MAGLILHGRYEMIELTEKILIDKASRTPRYIQVSRKIESLVRAREFQAGDKLPSDRDIASQIGVTPVTVSKGLQCLVRKGVLERKVGSGTFVAKPNVGNARSEGSRRVGMFCHYQISSDWYSSLVASVANEYWSGHKGDVIQIIRDGNGYFDAVREYDFDAVMVISPWIQFEEHLKSLKNNGIPFVVIGAMFNDLADHCFTNNDYNTARNAISYLAEAGHEKISLLPGHRNCPSSLARSKGFLQGMWDNHLPVNPKWFPDNELPLNHAEKAVEEYLYNVLKAEDKPTAFLAVSWGDTLKIYSVAKKLGLKIGKDISVIGFDDHEAAEHLHPALTAYSQPIERMVYDASQVLDGMLNGEMQMLSRDYESTLVKRESCCELQV